MQLLATQWVVLHEHLSAETGLAAVIRHVGADGINRLWRSARARTRRSEGSICAARSGGPVVGKRCHGRQWKARRKALAISSNTSAAAGINPFICAKPWIMPG